MEGVCAYWVPSTNKWAHNHFIFAHFTPRNPTSAHQKPTPRLLVRERREVLHWRSLLRRLPALLPMRASLLTLLRYSTGGSRQLSKQQVAALSLSLSLKTESSNGRSSILSICSCRDRQVQTHTRKATVQPFRMWTYVFGRGGEKQKVSPHISGLLLLGGTHTRPYEAYETYCSRSGRMVVTSPR